MIKSMTGYGKAEVAVVGKKITVEIRSLNGKQFDMSVKLPHLYRPFEYDIRNMVGKVLSRGKIEMFITMESVDATMKTSVNKELFASYFSMLKQLAAENGADMTGQESVLFRSALSMPEVISNNVDTVSEEEKAALFKAVEGAINALESFRIQEGAILIADLLGRIDRIMEYRDQVIPYEKSRIETIKNRIRESIESLSIPIDSNRLEQEMIFYVEKLDITEEKVRLENHCKYFREVAHEEENVGRKLGFIAQEMGREINTLGSKANNSEIQILVVKMKDELEKIKEQVLNIL